MATTIKEGPSDIEVIETCDIVGCSQMPTSIWDDGHEVCLAHFEELEDLDADGELDEEGATIQWKDGAATA